MPTDAGDIAGIAGSTMQGAAAGAVFGTPGIIVGGAIGLITGLFGNSAENEAERLAAQQIERERIAAGLSGEARELQLVLNAFDAARARKNYIARAIASGEAVSSAAIASGLKGSSIEANARSTLLQQRASNLQASFFTQNVGEGISDLLQQATDAQLGVNDAPDVTQLLSQEQPNLSNNAETLLATGQEPSTAAQFYNGTLYTPVQTN